jgi:hypothetical protein
MINKDLEFQVQNYRKHGITDKEIRNSLLNSGYAFRDIEAALGSSRPIPKSHFTNESAEKRYASTSDRVISDPVQRDQVSLPLNIKNENTLPILAIVFALTFPVLGLVVSVVFLKIVKNPNSRKLLMLSLAISLVMLFMLFFWPMILLLMSLVSKI